MTITEERRFMNEMSELYRNSVRLWECDQMGHLNVQFYVEKATAALAVLEQRLGLGDDGQRLVAREHHIRFLREQRPGVPVRLMGGVLDVDATHLRVYLEMRHAATDVVAATFVARVELTDAQREQTLPLPDSARNQADRLLVELPPHAAPRGLELTPPATLPRLEQADAMGMVPTYLTPLEPHLVDADGFMTTRGYMGVISDAVPNLLVHLSSDDPSTRGIGGAALEYRLVYHRTPRRGTVIALRSGIIDVGTKAYRFGHWMFDAGSGEPVAAAMAVAVLFDLEARKAIAIPDDRRVLLEKMIVPGLVV
ncbi:MAG: acyl-ACP thioesterase [Ectothiorhodospiraceae bacterium]|nr:acyl-ACP thioesterase [Ectothiorhodospiraceae bacterium]MCH8506799.1 thioesterase family protein [Ectothiorhodospiraceae bacterium]